MKSDNNLLSWISSAVSVACASMSTTEIAQTVLYVVGIISAVVSLAYNVYVWYGKAKKDGKITKDEIDELKKTVDDALSEVDKSSDKKDNK